MDGSGGHFGRLKTGLFQVLSKYFSFTVVVSQFARTMEYGQIAVDVSMHTHLGFHIVVAMPIRRYLQ